jgi:hypothetical protein
MLRIKFDPEAAKTALFEGPFDSREKLLAACETVTLPNSDYQKWAQDNGVDAATGSIFTTAYSPAYIKSRLATLEGQANDFTNGTETTGLKFTVPPMLTAAFEAAAQSHKTETPFKMLTISNTRETLYFNLRKAFPNMNLHAICATATADQALRSNGIIADKASAVAQSLTYTNAWKNQSYDLVHINAAVFYEARDGVRKMVQDIAATRAERVVFSNLINSSSDKEEWFAQRSRGGIVPMRALPTQEIVTLMQQVGYKLVDRNLAAVSYDVRASETEISRLLKNDNLSFVKDHAPA